jgi:hypothetical protein
MRKEIENIIQFSKHSKITCNQSLFLIAIHENLYSVDLPGDELLDLVRSGYIKGNRLTDKSTSLIESMLSGEKTVERQSKINAQYPKLTRETGEIVKVLADHLFRDYTKKEEQRLLKYNSNLIALPFLHLFMSMFPSSDDKKNAAWKKHFGVNASKVTLRRMTNGTARKFQQIWKTKDIGLFLLGTYIFIKETYNEDDDKYFVKKMENYLAEWNHWYDIAEDALESGELKRFTTRNKVKSSNNTTVI